MIIRPTVDEYFMIMAMHASSRGSCIRRRVGCILTDDKNHVLATGYNGPPAGTHNCDVEWPEEGCARDSKGSCSLALHAEQNAILYATKNNVSMEGATLYVTLSPCIACARVIFTIGIKKVFYKDSYAAYKGLASDEGVDFLQRFGVEVIKYKP